MDYLVELPAELAKDIIEKWLSLKCLVRTDFAHLGSRTHRQWSSIISSGHQITSPLDILTVRNYDARNGIVKWIIANRVQVSNIAMKRTSWENYRDLFVVAGPYLSKCTADLCSAEYEAIAAHCPNLTELHVLGEYLPRLTHVLENCTKLTKLHFSGMYYTLDDNGDRLNQVFLPLVEDLSLMNMEIADDTMTLCRSCPNTKRVLVRSPTMEGNGRIFIKEIARCMPLLEAIDICMEVGILRDSDVLCLVEHCPHIREVELAYNSYLTDASLVPMVQAYRPTHFALQYFSDGTLQALSEHCASTLLSLHLCNGRTDDLVSLALVAQHCTLLKVLRVAIWEFSPTSVPLWVQVFSHLHNIERLELQNIGYHTSFASEIAQTSPKLAYFHMYYCSAQFTAADLLVLLRACPRLEHFSLNHENEALCEQGIAKGYVGDPGLGIAAWTADERERVERILVRKQIWSFDSDTFQSYVVK